MIHPCHNAHCKTWITIHGLSTPEEPAKVDWTYGMGIVDEESGCAWSGGQKEKRKTEMGGLGEERLGGSGRGRENEDER